MFDYPLRQIGCHAAAVLETGGDGHVMAVFDHSYYASINGALLCLGNTNMGASPLNLVTSAPATTNWPASGVRIQDRVLIRGGNIRVGERFSFLTAGAAIWRPAAPVRNWDAARLEAGLAAFREKAERRIPSEGLGSFIRARSDNGCDLSDFANVPIGGLRRWLDAAIKTRETSPALDTAYLRQLIGLGPGLTPSGDDYVGGILIALHAVGMTALARRLWKEAEPHLRDAGNPISSAHVAAAAGGCGAECVHRTLSAVLTGQVDALDGAIAVVDRIGHTSGWDTVAGCVLVGDALLDAGIGAAPR